MSALLWYKFYKNEKQTDENFTSVPMSIYLFGVMLTGMSLYPYMSNVALREFAIKLLKNKLQAVWWPAQKRQKSTKQNFSGKIKVNSVHCVTNSNPTHDNTELRN